MMIITVIVVAIIVIIVCTTYHLISFPKNHNYYSTFLTAGQIKSQCSCNVAIIMMMMMLESLLYVRVSCELV